MATRTFDFYGTTMTVRLFTEEAAGRYSVIEMKHPPCVGPALHIHPAHPESFYVLEGCYTFWIDGKKVDAQPGQCVCVPPGAPHKYNVGESGGRVLVISPPNLEKYFSTVSNMLSTQDVSLDEERTIASRYGQHFLEMSSHWKATP